MTTAQRDDTDRRRRMRLGRAGVLAALAIAAFAAAGCGSSNTTAGTSASTGASGGGSQDKIKVVWLWYGPKDDGGYNVSQWREAQKQIEAKYGDRVEQVDVEKVPYSARGSQMADQVMRDGANLVIDAVAAGEIFTSVCQRHPDVNCIEVGPVGDYPNPTDQLPANVSGVFHEFLNQDDLAGRAAGGLK